MQNCIFCNVFCWLLDGEIFGGLNVSIICFREAKEMYLWIVFVFFGSLGKKMLWRNQIEIADFDYIFMFA